MEDVPVALRVNFALRELLSLAHDVQAALARRLGLGATDVQALQHLAFGTPMGTVDLAHALKIRSASATVLVDRLEAAGHVRRGPHPSDGRRITLVLSEAARDEVRVALAPLVDAVTRLTDGLAPEHAEVVARFLGDTTEVLRAYAAEPPEPG
ncbi:MarR family winged helix-turn-helix transcriptional regulator [Amycolatopsis sp. FBCC-B4732]|uniref:MarR family winged helix-turn-helix transcriptional regulator n=1 Tax=Amycolatopsis sp. FBCC-B4732 TaxID=3079339 RepID=UPI001FF35C83|nr:MarR family winged helix-turn-helix transcriptional regulator [Amycolatopsis sp. FBCC-B4732]UOX91862.1 MarR family winged helix-turn-helix transcriptional regulator [Amycolatopsis sp. FBCC-B4732]